MIHLFIDAKPFSVNKAWRGGARYRTNGYKDFEKEVLYQLPKVQIEGEVEIDFVFYVKNYSRSDTSNLIKCLEDILVHGGMIEDDRKVVALTAKKIKSNKERIEVEIKQYETK